MEKLLETARKFYSRHYDINEDNWDFLINDLHHFDNMTILELYKEIDSRLVSIDFFEYYIFSLNVYYTGDYSFLDEYNSNVKEFFINLIESNNKERQIIIVDIDFFFSFLKTINDLIQVYECLYKNSFLVRLPCKFENNELKRIHQENLLNKYKLKKLSEITNRKSQNIILNFIFSDRTEQVEINYIFLTDWYFNNSFSQDTYNFDLDYEYNENFLNQIVGYFKSWNIDLDMNESVLEKVSDFAQMYCMDDLYNLLNYEIKHQDNFYKREFINVTYCKKQYKYTVFCGNVYIFDDKNYCINKSNLRRLDRSVNYNLIASLIDKPSETIVLNDIEQKFFEIYSLNLIEY